MVVLVGLQRTMRETTFLASDQTTMLDSAPRARPDRIHVVRHSFESFEASRDRGSGDLEAIVNDELKPPAI